MAIDSVNSSISEVMNGNPAYVNMTEIIKDADGNIQLIHTDSSAVNALARAITYNAQNRLSVLETDGIKIPLGSLSGIPFFSGRGPNISIKAISVGNIGISFDSEFVSVGINQTMHRLFIEVTADLNIIIPGANNKVTAATQVLISECLIIGKVPDVYLDSDAADVSYDLVP